MDAGITFATLSAFSLAFTVIIDRLLMVDLYDGNPRHAWFVSSTLGAVLGLAATILIGIVAYGISWTDFVTGALTGTHWPISWQMVFAGALASVTLRSYFGLFAHHALTTPIALAITSTPVFVFAVELLLSREIWTPAASLSVFVTVAGLIGFEMLSQHDHDTGKSKGEWRIPLFIALSTAYIVFTDHAVDQAVDRYGKTPSEAAIYAMPYYWLGFALGIYEIAFADTRRAVRKLIESRAFILTILFMEIAGASFYIFENLGFSSLDATMTALIVGFDVVIVWLFDRYIQMRKERVQIEPMKIFFMRIDLRNLDIDLFDNHTAAKQIACIFLALLGILLWPK